MKFCIAFLKQLRRSAVLNFLLSVKYIYKNCKLAYRSDSAVFAHNTENRKLRTAMNSCRGFRTATQKLTSVGSSPYLSPLHPHLNIQPMNPSKSPTTPPSPRNKLSRTQKQNDPPPQPRGASHRQGGTIEGWGTRTEHGCMYRYLKFSARVFRSS